MRVYTAFSVGAFTAYIIYHAVMLNGSYAFGAAVAEALTAGTVIAIHTLKKGKAYGKHKTSRFKNIP